MQIFRTTHGITVVAPITKLLMGYSIMEVIPTILHGLVGIKISGLQIALTAVSGIRVAYQVMGGILADAKTLYIRFKYTWYRESHASR